MDHVNLGRTALKVSRLCLGTMNFGPFTTQADSFTIMDEALEQGINFFDTANVYGRHAGLGATERILGDWFEQGGSRREKVVLATKVFGRTSEWPNDSKLSARHIRQACDHSLERLKTDHIDLYQMHHIDRSAAWDEVWQAMETLVQQGKVIYVGSSNFAGWHIAQAQAAASSRHFLGLVSEQCLYNLTERTVEMEILPACADLGLGVIPWSPLAGGLLGGIDSGDEGSRRRSTYAQEKLETLRPQLERYEKLCTEIGESPADVALAWLLTRPEVTSAIIGPRTPAQFTGSLRSVAIKLEDAFISKLDEIFPGPGPAPESFAW